MATALLTLRKATRVSLSELSAAVDVTKGQLSRIERGESRPSAKTVEKLFVYFDGAVTREELMFPEVESKKPVRSAAGTHPDAAARKPARSATLQEAR